MRQGRCKVRQTFGVLKKLLKLNDGRQGEGGTLASVIVDITITCGTMQYFFVRNSLILL